MYLDMLRVENFRTFRQAEIRLLHPDLTDAVRKESFGAQKEVLYPNLNVILGNNGSGKSALLRAVALACLGPTVRDSGIYAYRLVRREPKAHVLPKAAAAAKLRTSKLPALASRSTMASIEAVFVPHVQDRVRKSLKSLVSRVRIERRHDLETLQYVERRGDATNWRAIFSDSIDAFFFVGYGAARRTELREKADPSSRRKARSLRASRVLGLFDDDTSLIPLSSWLPAYRSRNPGRYKQALHLLQNVTSDSYYRFTGEMEGGEYLFQLGEQRVPFPALSDGYRAFFGWIGDLLYHVCATVPSGRKLVENKGIVLVDEIDLHLHPKWQMEVLPRLSEALPNIQFIVTTHSPLIVGSIQRANLIVLQPGPDQSSTLKRESVAVHGLDADQVLVTPYFQLDTTRAGEQSKHLKKLSNDAAGGDRDAASQLLREMSRGAEDFGPEKTALKLPVKVTRNAVARGKPVRKVAAKRAEK